MVPPPHPGERAIPMSLDPPPTQPGEFSMSFTLPVSTFIDPSQPSPPPYTFTGTDLIQSTFSSGLISGISTPTTSTTPPFTPITSHTVFSSIPNLSTSSHTHTGVIVGGVIGGVAGIALIAALTFLCLRRWPRTARGAGGYRPSPRMKSNLWIVPTVRSARVRAPKERLASLEGDTDLAGSAPPPSYPAQSTPARETDSNGSRPASGLPPHFAFRNLSSSSAPRDLPGGARGSFPMTVSPVASNASYDTDRYNGAIPDDLNIRQSFPVDVDPFGSRSSIASAAAVNAVGDSPDVRRSPSINRVVRKPVPAFDGDFETVGGSESAVGCDRLATDITRSGSRSTSDEGRVSNASLGSPVLPGFKFAGGKEGPVHYLIPDLPNATVRR